MHMPESNQSNVKDANSEDQVKWKETIPLKSRTRLKEPSGETPTLFLIRCAPMKQTDRLDVKTQGSLMVELQVETYLMQETVDSTTRLGS